MPTPTRSVRVRPWEIPDLTIELSGHSPSRTTRPNCREPAAVVPFTALPSPSHAAGPEPAPAHCAEFVVEGYLNGVRIDSFLEKHLRNYTPYRLHRAIRAGLVKVNDEVVVLSRRVYRGNRVTVRLLDPPDKLLIPQDRPLDILYEDPWLLAVNKPPGLVAHPCGDYQTGTLANAVQAHLDRLTPLPGLLRPGIVHRLDRLTSGVIVVPKEHLSHRRLSVQFQQERVSKSYLALVEGIVPRDSGVVDLPIGRFPGGSSILATCRAEAIDPQPARTRYDVLQRYRRHTLVRCRPATGRFHQIRVHLATIGHPVVADEFYEAHGTVRPPRARPLTEAEKSRRFDSDPDEDETAQESFDDSEAASSNLGGDVADDLHQMRRHALHAHRIAFTHPITQEWMEFAAPLANDMQRAVEALAAECGMAAVLSD